MNIKNFSLDYIQPGETGQASAAVDPWADAVNYYGPHIRRTLQEVGHKSIQELYQTIQSTLKPNQLGYEQFVVVIDRLILNKQLIVVKQGPSQGDFVVALPVG